MGNSSAERMNKIADRISGELHTVMAQIVNNLDYKKKQEAFDTLRGCHQALSLHVGLVERMLLASQTVEGVPDLHKALRAEREKSIASSVEHIHMANKPSGH